MTYQTSVNENIRPSSPKFAELRRRKWTRADLTGLAGANLLRILEKAEFVARRQAFEGQGPSYDIYDKRPDLPVRWSGDEL